MNSVGPCDPLQHTVYVHLAIKRYYHYHGELMTKIHHALTANLSVNTPISFFYIIHYSSFTRKKISHFSRPMNTFSVVSSLSQWSHSECLKYLLCIKKTRYIAVFNAGNFFSFIMKEIGNCGSTDYACHIPDNGLYLYACTT